MKHRATCTEIESEPRFGADWGVNVLPTHRLVYMPRTITAVYRQMPSERPAGSSPEKSELRIGQRRRLTYLKAKRGAPGLNRQSA